MRVHERMLLTPWKEQGKKSTRTTSTKINASLGVCVCNRVPSLYGTRCTRGGLSQSLRKYSMRRKQHSNHRRGRNQRKAFNHEDLVIDADGGRRGLTAPISESETPLYNKSNPDRVNNRRMHSWPLYLEGEDRVKRGRPSPLFPSSSTFCL